MPLLTVWKSCPTPKAPCICPAISPCLLLWPAYLATMESLPPVTNLVSAGIAVFLARKRICNKRDLRKNYNMSKPKPGIER